MSTTPRTLSERDETYVGDIVRDENWLVNSSCTFSAPPNTITLHSANKEVLRITHDGRLVTGEGLSADEATQEAAKLLIASFEEQIQKMVEKRIAAELARLRADLERFTGHGLLDCHAICDQRDAAITRAERAEAALQKIRDVMRQDSNGKDPMDAVEDIMHAAASETPARSE